MADNSSWIQYFDEETGAPYLYNEDTGESRWIIPDEQYDTYSQQQYDQPDYQSEYLTNDYNGAATYDQNYGYYGNYGNNNYENQQNYDPVTTELWEEYFDDFGNPYYYNNVSSYSLC